VQLAEHAARLGADAGGGREARTGYHLEAALRRAAVDAKRARIDALLVLVTHAHGHVRPIVLLADDGRRIRFGCAATDLASHAHSSPVLAGSLQELRKRMCGFSPARGQSTTRRADRFSASRTYSTVSVGI
jgi:hypothetical protein